MRSTTWQFSRDPFDMMREIATETTASCENVDILVQDSYKTFTYEYIDICECAYKHDSKICLFCHIGHAAIRGAWGCDEAMSHRILWLLGTSGEDQSGRGSIFAHP